MFGSRQRVINSPQTTRQSSSISNARCCLTRILAFAVIISYVIFILTSISKQLNNQAVGERTIQHPPSDEHLYRIKSAKKLYVVLVANDFVQQFPLIGYGGIEAAVQTLAEELHRSGVKFSVITPKITIPPAVPYKFNILQTPHVSGRGSAEFVRDVKQVIQQMDPQPDVIWSQSSWSGNNLHDLGIPMIVSHQDSGDGEDIYLGRYHNVLHRFISQSQMDLWSKHKPWINEGTDAFKLWYGFSPEEFQLNTNKTPKTCIFVGRLIEEKGIQEFTELARWNPDWTFYSYGPGSINGYEPPPNVKHRGELNRGEVHREVFGMGSRFFMFVQYQEAFGRVVLEAASKGTPVLASNVGSLPEIIRGPDGAGEGIIGTISNSMEHLNASLHMQYDYERVYQYAREHFSVRKELESLLLKSLDLVEKVNIQKMSK